MQIERTSIIATNAEADRAKAIAAYASGILSQPVVIRPSGKRSARTVQTARGTQIRLYLSGRLYQRGATVSEARAWAA